LAEKDENMPVKLSIDLKVVYFELSVYLFSRVVKEFMILLKNENSE
jgi:hypothetical protein